MTVDDAIAKACADVGIVPPKTRAHGKWVITDTLSGKNGKGDGRVMIDDFRVVGWNWQTGMKASVSLKDGELTAGERETARKNMEKAREQKVAAAQRAAAVASEIVGAARSSRHPYLAAKGFPDETALVIGIGALAPILEAHRKSAASLIPVGARSALVMPGRIGSRLTTVELIWEDGTKKFLAGGELSGASCRIASGRDTWLCEGLATGLSLRMALKGTGRSDTVLCCFSAANVSAVSESIKDRCFIATDNDKPLPEFGGIGTGEYWARRAGKPYVMPPDLGDDFNDLHQARGIFAVQAVLSKFVREAR